MNEVNFSILETSIVGNGILVRPYSTEFKRPSAEYSPVNINISNLNPDKDILIQIAEYMKPIVSAILNFESDVTHFTPLISGLPIDSVQTVPVSSLYNQPPQLFPSSDLQDIVTNVTVFELQNTLNNMASAQLLEGIEFIN
jgi:hypothetical protein